jgi:hypothetical protein
LATVAWPPTGLDDDEHWRLRATVGRPVCGVEVRIVDDQDNALPHDGKAVGEIEVRGPWITGSYYGGHDAAKFCGDWMRTGDVGRIDPLGFVTLTDRAKDVIKSGGEWISSVDLETTLIAHPAVLEPDPASCGSSWRTRSPAGGCQNGGRLLMESREPAWASSTRRPSGLATPSTPTRSSSTGDNTVATLQRPA